LHIEPLAKSSWFLSCRQVAFNQYYCLGFWNYHREYQVSLVCL